LSEDALRNLGYYGFPQAREIKPFNLTDHHGNPVSEQDLKGEWQLMFFGFTFCPDICPTTMGVLNRAIAELPTKPQVVMVTVDPERDTPEALARYVPSFNPEFVGYTGTFDDIVGLATNVNIAFGKVPGKEPGTYTMDHAASIVVVDPQGRYAGFIKAPHQATNISQIMASLML
ncbi:MAG: SCO family protein, partial [Pseudomonadales bacterium]